MVGLAQQSDSLYNISIPDYALKNMEGELVHSSTISNVGHPLVICFWKTCCKTPNKLLSAINENYEEWEEETGVKFIIISVDDSRSSAGVKSFVNTQGWEFEVLLDENSDLKRAMNVNIIPHLFLYDGKGNLFWQKQSFIEGDEYEIYEKILETIK